MKKLFQLFTKKAIVICILAIFAIVAYLTFVDKTIVVCAGDSLTYGSGVLKTRDKDSYPAQLQALLGKDFEVINCGLRNATASYAGDLPYGVSKEHDRSMNDEASMVILMLGANDTKTYNWDPEEYRAGLEWLILAYEGLKSQPQIVLMRPPYTFAEDGGEIAAYEIQPAVGRDEVGEIINDVAAEHGLTVIDLYSVTEGKQELYTDGIHFTRDGYSLIANTVYEVIAEKIK